MRPACTTQWYLCHVVVSRLTRLILHCPGVVLAHFSLGSCCPVPILFGRAKNLPVFFPTHYSFRGKFEKRYFNSSQVSSHLDEGLLLCLSPGFIRSSFRSSKNEYHPRRGYRTCAAPAGLHSTNRLHSQFERVRPCSLFTIPHLQKTAQNIKFS
jgi:hypothetical protein